MHLEQPFQPKVTVVTVVFNSMGTIEATMKSVFEQTYQNIEYIVIDGGSGDGTLDIISRYQIKLANFISEPDRGIYDAMNKGIALAQGDWIYFLNSGDLLHSPQTLDSIFSNMVSDFDVIYGPCLVKYPEYSRLKKSNKISKLRMGLPSCHQGFFIRTSLARANGFNLNEGLAADYGMICACYKNKAKFEMISTVISDYLTDGVSDIQRVNVYRSIFRISHKYFGFHIWYSFRLILLIGKEYLQSHVLKLFGKRFIEKLRALRHGHFEGLL